MKITTYNPDHEASLLDLERRSPQGKLVQLVMSRTRFLSRAIVFDAFEAFVAEEEGQLVGTAIGGKVPLIHNGVMHWAGYGFDVKVSPTHRGRKIAQRLARHIVENFFLNHDLTRQFITLKKSNHPVVALTANVIKKMSLVEFVYLTIPTASQLGPHKGFRNDQKFSVSLLSGQELLRDHYVIAEKNLSYWLLDKTYKLRIEKIHPIVKVLMALYSKVSRLAKYVPREGSTISSAILFNHNATNMDKLNNVLGQLVERQIDYLLVCCRRGDDVYRWLSHYSINTYGYYLLFNYEVKKQDSITIDVRCL